MGDERDVWIEHGTIHIDDAEIEANLHELARRQGVPIEEALYRALVNAASEVEDQDPGATAETLARHSR